jgi:ribosome-associated translation inhibitor RaiA
MRAYIGVVQRAILIKYLNMTTSLKGVMLRVGAIRHRVDRGRSAPIFNKGGRMQYLNLDSVTPEIRAYIYQQLADLEPHLPEGSAISIVINENPKSGSHASTIKVDTPYGEVSAIEEKQDIYESLSAAKDSLVKHMGEVTRAMMDGEATEAELLLDAVKNARILH